jgi:hypothetical protein
MIFMGKERIVKHHFYQVRQEFVGCNTDPEITDRAYEIVGQLGNMLNPWDEPMYPDLDEDSMAAAHIKIANAIESGNYRVIDDYNNLGRQSYDAICKACPNYRGPFSLRCNIRRFETYGF